MSYEYAPKPCKYNGIQYRSRLEAKWAAFFEFIGWKYDYEPVEFELKGWMPDFYISNLQLLIEVKPYSQWSEEVLNKIKPHASTLRCGIIAEDIYSDESSYYLGKEFNQGEGLILIDITIPYKGNYNKYVIRNLWKEAQNKVMYLNPAA